MRTSKIDQALADRILDRKKIADPKKPGLLSRVLARIRPANADSFASAEIAKRIAEREGRGLPARALR